MLGPPVKASGGSATDGVEGFTDSHDYNGVVGINDASTNVPDPQPGQPPRPSGNGVFGYSKVPNA
jgi:hypothetical protein